MRTRTIGLILVLSVSLGIPYFIQAGSESPGGADDKPFGL